MSERMMAEFLNLTERFIHVYIKVRSVIADVAGKSQIITERPRSMKYGTSFI